MYPHPRWRRLVAFGTVLALLWLLARPAVSNTVAAAPSTLALSTALQITPQPQANVLDVVISEIAWMGTTTSSADEWLELYNNTASTVALAGWNLQAGDGSPVIALSGSIPPHSYYLLERTDDTTVPDVPADLIFSGSLEDSGEDLRLLDAAATVVDQVDASAGWVAGHGPGRVPMVRRDTTLPGAADNWTYNPRCGDATNSAGISHTCTLTVTYTSADLDYAVYFNPLFVTASTITTTVTPMESALLTLIGDASTTLDAAVYGLDRQSIIDALIAAHNRGVTVRVVGDDEAAAIDYYPGYQALSNAGLTVITDTSSYIQHNKFIVINGQVVWTGSTNLTDTGFTLNANNSLAITSTHLAAIYTTEFNEMWSGNFHAAKTDNTAHLLDYNGTLVEVYFSPTDLGAFAIWDALNTVTETLHFAQFFWTDTILSGRAIERLNVGAAVAGVWDQLGAANAYSVDEDLVTAGGRVRIENFSGKLHHKVAVLDPYGAGPTVITGSYNWTASGGYENDENLLIIHDAALAQVYEAEINSIWTAINPSVVTITRYNALPTWLLALLLSFVSVISVMCSRPPRRSRACHSVTSTSPGRKMYPITKQQRFSACLLWLLVLLFLTSPVRAAGVLDVVISEIAWMGTTTSSADEWLELYNNTASTVDLTGWTLQATDGTPLITLSGSIPPYSYYLLERSDDTTLPAITADDTYSGSLEDTGEDLRLLDAAATLIDQVDASGGWFAGHDVGVPMVRVDTTVSGNQATNWTYSPRCGNPTNTAGIRYTCALTTTTTGTDLDYAVYFNERATTASSTTLEQTTVETALLQVIGNTADTLDVALYGLDRQSVVDALITAHQRGVAVRIVGDDDASQEAGYIAAYQALRDAGITIITDASGDIQHNKFVVSDGQVVWTGSTNLTDNCLTLNANNSIVITSTTLAEVYATEFAEMWGGAFHTAKTDNTAHLFDYDGTLVESYFSPSDLPAFEVWDELVQTTESVHFAMFFWTDPVLTNRVLERLADGVQVYGIFDQLGAANASSPDEQFCAAGAHIGIEDLPGLVHHKFAVLDVFGDNPRVVLGSYNWTDSGAYGNDENTLIIHHRGLAEAYYAEWERLWRTLDPGQVCNPVPLAHVQISGPSEGNPLTTYDFLATVNAMDVPITYTWEATGQTPVSHVGRGLTDTVQFTWEVTGTQIVTVTASNAFTTVVDTHLLVITTTAPTDYYVYLPMVARAMPAPSSGPDIRITHIEHTPTGDAVQDEYVRIENFADAAQEMTGWTLRDEANRTFTFPVFTLPAGGVVKVWTGSGTNTATDLYWSSGTAIWNNTGDTAYLRDAAGEVVDTYTY